MSGMSQAVNALALHVDVVDGANISTSTVTGIATTDTIIGVGHVTPGATLTIADVTSHISISAADTILSDADYSSDNLIVIWHDGSQAVSARQARDPIRLRVSLVDGGDGTVSTTTTLTGLATDDQLVGAVLLETKADAAAVSDCLSYLSITAADTITITGLDCSNDQIMVFWMDSDAVDPQSYSNVALRFDVVAGHSSTQTLTGATASDVLVSAMKWPATTVAVADVTSICTLGTNKVDFSSSTASSSVMLLWYDVSA